VNHRAVQFWKNPPGDLNPRHAASRTRIGMEIEDIELSLRAPDLNRRPRNQRLPIAQSEPATARPRWEGLVSNLVSIRVSACPYMAACGRRWPCIFAASCVFHHLGALVHNSRSRSTIVV